MPDDLSIKDFGASFKGFLEQVTANAPPPEDPFFTKRLREHFGQDAALLPTLTESFQASDHANVQLAVTSYIAEHAQSHELLGVVTEHPVYDRVSFAQLVAPAGRHSYAGGVTQGPVEYVNLPAGQDEVLACVQRGIYLIDGPARLAVVLQGPGGFSSEKNVTLSVMSVEKSSSEAFLAAIRKGMRTRNIYRGRIVTLSWDHGLVVNFQRLPSVDRHGIILPEGLLERVERHTVHFSRVASRLLSAARHLKRGLLLHGAPGTGKTLTAMYIAGQSPDRTVIILTGRSLGLIEHASAMARALQPATIIIEDVDLIAEERTHQGQACNTVLFELLNVMDGLADDADVLFVLTTNRPDILEPALASRPGRIDQAIEVPLPDATCRRRLFELYGRGLNLSVADLDSFVKRTEGVSAAFIRELLRRAALFAADEGDAIQVTDHHIDQAIHELIVTGGELTKSLLGARR